MERSIDPHEVLWLDRSSTWMDPIRACLANGAMLADQKEADQVKRRSNWFILYKGGLVQAILHPASFMMRNPRVGEKDTRRVK